MLGYTNQLPPPVNLVVQAIMASIESFDVHKLIQAIDLETLSTSGQCRFGTIGAQHSRNFAMVEYLPDAEKDGILKALSCLWQYIGVLALFES